MSDLVVTSFTETKYDIMIPKNKENFFVWLKMNSTQGGCQIQHSQCFLFK